MTYGQKLKDPRWQKKRLEILNRDNFTCRFCADDKSTLHVHHISYNGEPWNADERLLITLCEKCHNFEEEKMKDLSTRFIKSLRNSGITSFGLVSIMALVENAKDRGWECGDDGFDILQHCINDDLFWGEMRKEYEKQFTNGTTKTK